MQRRVILTFVGCAGKSLQGPTTNMVMSLPFLERLTMPRKSLSKPNRLLTQRIISLTSLKYSKNERKDIQCCGNLKRPWIFTKTPTNSSHSDPCVISVLTQLSKHKHMLLVETLMKASS